MLMIEPPPLALIAGIVYLQPRKTPSFMTAFWKRKSSSVQASGVAIRTMPALLTSTCKPPNLSTAAAMTSCHRASSRTSWRMNNALSGRCAFNSVGELAAVGFVHVRDEDPGPLAMQRNRVGAPETCRAARDDRDLAGYTSHRWCLARCCFRPTAGRAPARRETSSQLIRFQSPLTFSDSRPKLSGIAYYNDHRRSDHERP